MTTKEIANRLYKLCKEGKYGVAHAELYAENITSTEKNQNGFMETFSGLDIIKQRTVQFQGLITERHSGYVKKPKVFDNHIFVEMGMDVQMTGIGRLILNEMCHYEVKDGKIVSEIFYY
jgi:hypothetical protein